MLTSLGLCVFGQNFSNPQMTGSVKEGSFSKNCTIQYANYKENEISNTFQIFIYLTCGW